MFKDLVGLPSQRRPDSSIDVGKVPHGLNTYEPADRLAITEASKLINWKIEKGGKKTPRLPIAVYSTAATTNAIKYIKAVNIGGTDYELVIDSGYKLYYLNGSLVPTLIGTLEGDATVLNYNGIVIIFDGSYIKYIEDVSTIKIAYDGGTGSSGNQFDFTADDSNQTKALGNGTNLGVAQRFKTQTWTAPYSIPPVKVSAYLSENGTAPTGAITCKIRNASDTSIILASKTFLVDADDLGSTASEYSMTFESSDITNELLQNTTYICSLEYSAGDAGNYVVVHCNNPGGTGELLYGVTDLDVPGNWSLDINRNCLMSLTPGRPPKGNYGVAWNNRPWVWGDPDNLGVMHYGNLSHLDWSTSNGGGSLGIVDDSGDAYEVGSAEPFWDALHVFGTQLQPYMVKISGTEPDNYAQSKIFNEPWTVPLGVVNSVNELWFVNGDGISPISGVQEYGDFRTNLASEPIYDRLKDYWDSSTCFAGYYAKDGQLWLVMPTYNRILVCHVKLGVPGPDGQSVRYPWTEYELYRYELTDTDTYKWTKDASNEYYVQTLAGGDPSIDSKPDFVIMDGVKLTEGTQGSLTDHEWDYDSTPGYPTIYVKDATGDPDTSGVSVKTIMLPTCLEQSGANMLLGGSDKFIYKINAAATAFTDMASIGIAPVWASGWVEVPGGYAEFSKLQALMSAETAPTGTEMVTNGEFSTTTDDWTTGIGLTSATVVDSSSDPGSASGGTDNNCAKLICNGLGTLGRISQIINIEDGKSYEIFCRVYAKSANQYQNAAMMLISGKDINGNSTTHAAIPIVDEDAWETLSTIITVYGSTINVQLYVLGTYSGDIAYFDKVSCIRETAFSSMDVNIHTDRQYTTPTGTITLQLPETSTEQQEQLFQFISFIGWSIMIETDNISMSSPIFDDGLRLWFRALQT